MPSDNYRYFCHDFEGRLHAAKTFCAASDEDAVAQIAAKHPYDYCKIWHGNRLVQAVGQKNHAINESEEGSKNRHDCFRRQQGWLRQARRRGRLTHPERIGVVFTLKANHRRPRLGVKEYERACVLA